MTAKVIDGKALALKMCSEVATRVTELQKRHSQTPAMAIILVGRNPINSMYVDIKREYAEKAGINVEIIELPEVMRQDELIAYIQKLNDDDDIHAILVQTPLPKTIEVSNVFEAIAPYKDIDGLNPVNIGKLVTGRLFDNNPAVVPCVAQGCLQLIKDALENEELEGKKALVIGRSLGVGKPIAYLLLREGCTITIAHSHTKDLKSECLQADILVSATGVPKLVTADMIKKGAIVIDVGRNIVIDENGEGKIIGDVDFDTVREIAAAITPVNNGVEYMTMASMLWNVLHLYWWQMK